MFHFTARSFARADLFVKSMGKQTRKSHIGAGVSSDESGREVFNHQSAEIDRAIARMARRVQCLK